MIDTLKVADIIVYQRYWNDKIRVCWALSKTSENQVMKPKEKRKQTRTEASSYRNHSWSTIEIWRCSLLLFKMFGACKIWNNFFRFIVSCCFKWGQYIALSTCPIGWDSWWKYNAVKAILQTPKLINWSRSSKRHYL